MNKYFSQLGFTLLELLIVLALLALMIMMATPHLLGQREKRVLLTERDEMTTVLKEAQNKSMVAEDGYAYGVKLSGTNYNVFQDGGVDVGKVYTIHKSLVVVWLGDVVFEKLTGASKSSTTQVIELSTGKFSTSIEVTPNGLIEVKSLN